MAENWNSSVVFLIILPLIMAVLPSVLADVPAVFIFGDSTADVGTNNHFTNTIAKANFPYNGIDFPGSIATGRFSNGFNSADYLSQLMGFPMSPKSFLDLIDNTTLLPTKDVMKGVNFASAASGLLESSGKFLGKNIPLSEQIQQFAAVRQKAEELLGREEAETFLSKSMVFISIGSNDIFTHYFFNHTRVKHFITTLRITYEMHLRTLYSIGARKFGIISVPPLGCCPSQRAQNHTRGGCVQPLNKYALSFYSAIGPMLQNVSSELTDMKYSLGNAYQMVVHMMHDPQPFGFKDLQNACCGYGRWNGQDQCSVTAKLCTNRDEYLFWDWNHPTQAASKLAAEILYTGPTLFVKPINFKQLAEA